MDYSQFKKEISLVEFFKSQQKRIWQIVLRVFPVFLLSVLVGWYIRRYFGMYSFEVLRHFPLFSIYSLPAYFFNTLGFVFLFSMLNSHVLLYKEYGNKSFSIKEAVVPARKMFFKLILPTVIYLVVVVLLSRMWYFFSLLMAGLLVFVPFGLMIEKGQLNFSSVIERIKNLPANSKKNLIVGLFLSIIAYYLITWIFSLVFQFGYNPVVNLTYQAIVWYVKLYILAALYYYANTLYFAKINIRITDLFSDKNDRNFKSSIIEEAEVIREDEKKSEQSFDTIDERNRKRKFRDKKQNEGYNRFEHMDDEDVSF